MTDLVRFIDRDDEAPWGDTPPGANDAWVIGVRAKTGPVAGACARIPDAADWIAPLKIDGTTAGACAVVRQAEPIGTGWCGAVGLGTPHALTASVAETIGRKLGAALCKPGLERVFIEADLFPVTAAALAAGLTLRTTPQLDMRSDEEKAKEDAFTAANAQPTEIIILTTNVELAEAAWQNQFRPRVDGTLFARDLMHCPANLLNPATFQEQAESLQELGVNVSVLNATALKQNKLNLLHAVGKGAKLPARLIIMEWPGTGAPDAAPVALVGKGITFDTGGISIKPAAGMEEMKGDMGGAAAVLGTMMTLALRKSSQRVIGLLAVAENAVSGTATRPGDVLKACNGISVEIIDTDAEGRLVLADALAYAVKTYAPSLIVDAATLTGAVVRALGRHHAGLFAVNDDAVAELTAAAEAANEPVWRLPLPMDTDAALKSDVADYKNCSWESETWGPVPDAMHAAGFLSKFVGDTPWVHLDIAGTADADKDSATDRKGPRGFGVALLNTVIARREA